MKSRKPKQKEQDSDRQGHYGSGPNETKEKNGTNKGERLLEPHGDSGVSKIETNTARDRTANLHTGRATLSNHPVTAREDEHSKPHAPSPHNPPFIYFPLNYSFPPNNQQFEAPNTNNYKYYTGPSHYPPGHSYPPRHYFSSYHPSFCAPAFCAPAFYAPARMAPFDDKTYVASNSNSNIHKNKEVIRPLAVKTTSDRTNPRRRDEEVLLRPSPPACLAPPVPPPPPTSYNSGFFLDRLGKSTHRHRHFRFYDEDSSAERTQAHGYDHDYDHDGCTSSAATPQRSNQSATVASRATRSHEQGRYSPVAVPPPRTHPCGSTAGDARADAPPPDHPCQHDRHYGYPPPAYYSSGWYGPEYAPQPYPPQAYDQRYFSPSPPPPPLPDYYRQGYASSNSSFSLPSGPSPPPPAWCEGGNDEGSRRRSPCVRHSGHPVSTPGGFGRSGCPSPHTPAAQGSIERPETPCSDYSENAISRVTPVGKDGRKKVSPEAVRINFPASSTKAIVTPGDKRKTSASTFLPSLPFVELRDTDIVCGRGAPTNYHAGNEEFRQLVSEYQTDYFIAKRSEKPNIAMNIMEVLQSRGARFVRRQKGRRTTPTPQGGNTKGASSPSQWVEVPSKIAYEKVCQALRERTSNIHKQMLSTPSLVNTMRTSRIQNVLGCNSRTPGRHSGGRINKGGTAIDEGKENGDLAN